MKLPQWHPISEQPPDEILLVRYTYEDDDTEGVGFAFVSPTWVLAEPYRSLYGKIKRHGKDSLSSEEFETFLDCDWNNLSHRQLKQWISEDGELWNENVTHWMRVE